MHFQSLGLSEKLLTAIAEQGYETPTEIQRQAIPVILKGNDVMGLAQTGTGKTASFTLPLLQILSQAQPVAKRMVRALILTPTRELAAQVGDNLKAYGKYLDLKSEVIFGGVSIRPQIKAMERGTDIVIATPGRLLDLVEQKAINLNAVEILVLDEADRMLDLGFIHSIKKIIALLPKKRQNMLFSATLSADIQVIADSFLKNPQIIEVARRNVAANLVTQVVHPVDHKRKRELLSFIIGSRNWQQVLVFTKTKHGANHLCEQLIADGLASAAIHGNKSQGARTKALADFKSGKIRVLVATDIAARGIDIDNLPYVVNFNLPNVPEDYVHRIGRTGRAGNEGHAVSLVSADEKNLLKDIERVLKSHIRQEIIPGYQPQVVPANEIARKVSSYAPRAPKPNASKSNAPKNNKAPLELGKKKFSSRNAPHKSKQTASESRSRSKSW